LISGEYSMTTNMASAVFDPSEGATRAVADLRRANVPDRALSIVTTNNSIATTADGVGDVTYDGHGSIISGILGGGGLGAGATDILYLTGGHSSHRSRLTA